MNILTHNHKNEDNMFDKYTTVNGIRVKLNPYSEARFKQLQVVNQEISDWIGENQEKTINDIPAELKEKWWKAKAEILWTPDSPFSDVFFSN